MRVLGAQCPVTDRQLGVIRDMARGMTTPQIAARDGVTASTIRQVAHAAYRKLGVHSAAQAAYALGRDGWLDYKAHDDEGPLSGALRAYMAAFDRYQQAGKARDAQAEQRARTEMLYLLGGAFLEAGRPVPEAQRAALRALARVLTA